MTKQSLTKLFWILALVLVFLAPANALAEDLSIGDLFPFGWWGPLVACNGEVCTSLCQVLDLIQRLIYFGLSLLIFAITPIMVLIGGGMIMMSRGEEMLSKGKKMVTGAIVGLAIGLLSFVIISTFLWLIGNNTRESGKPRVAWPDIQCRVEGLSILPPPPAGSLDNGTPPAGPGQQVQPCPTCINFGGGQIVFKEGVGTQASSPKMIDAIYCFDNDPRTNFQIRVTEAYPPTYLEHDSPQHYNGCAIDFTIDVTPVAFVYANSIRPAAEDCGLVAANEYDDPSPQATGNHIHLNLPPSACP